MRSAYSFLPACALFLAVACNTTTSKVAFSKEEYRAKNESVLYVFRERAFVGGGMKTVLFFDDKSVGILPQYGYYPIHAIAGTHKLKGCSSDLLATEECQEINVDMRANDFTIIQLKMKLDPKPRVFLIKATDIAVLADSKNEGNFYDSALRDTMPALQKKTVLSASNLGQAEKSPGPLKIAIINFTDLTGSNLHGWLSESLPDAIDQSMRRDFEYKRHATQAGANIVISGSYRSIGNDRILVEAQVLYADNKTVLATETVDSPVDAQIFSSTKLLSDKLVAKLHQIVRKQ